MTDVKASMLIVDDDPAVGTVLGALLEQAGLDWSHVDSGEAALRALEEHPFEVVITDVRMPGMDGMALLGAVQTRWPGLPVVLMTAHGTIGLAVDAMKAGAADFLLKPFDREEILYTLRKALTASQRHQQGAPPAPDSGTTIVGDSQSMRELNQMIRRVAPGTATVLLLGETGTGKGLIAQQIHAASPRSAKPVVTVQCAALPDALLESELFGHEKGAFTGAVARKPGRVELAEGGSIFLDEIGDVTPALQVKLLRLLQEREYERLGGTETRRADVRFIAATHRDIERMVADGTFREDLYYRLSVVPIWVPPLRDRGDDVAALARHFGRVYGEANARPGIAFAPEALQFLSAQTWAGNVRQLQNFVERLVVLSDEDTITVAAAEREFARGPLGQQPSEPSAAGGSLEEQRSAAEREALRAALQRTDNNRSKAARLLGVSRRTLYNKLREYDLT